ncbi:MAG: hypothetical protein WD994_01050, partial [Pseudomonadales bacterium]
MKRAPAQAALLRLLRGSDPSGLTRTRLKQAAVTAGVIRALVDKGFAAWISRRLGDQAPFDPGGVDYKATIELTEAQHQVVASIAAAGTKPSLL